MKYDKVTVIGVIACIAAFVFLLWWTPKMSPRPASVPVVTEQTAAAPQAAPAAAKAPQAAAPAAKLPAAAAVTAEDKTYHPQEALPKSDTAPLRIVRGEDCALSIDREGAGITAVELFRHKIKKSRKGEDDGGNVILGSYDFPLMNLNTQAAGITLAPGKAEALTGEKQGLRITRLSTDGKLSFQEEWLPDPTHSYEITYRLKITNLSKDAVAVKGLRLDTGSLPVTFSPGRKTGAMNGTAGGVAYGVFGKNSSVMLNMKDVTKKMTPEKQQELAILPVSWVTVHSKYFLFSLRPEGNTAFKGLEANACPPLEGLEGKFLRFHSRAILADTVLNAGVSSEQVFSAYAGPKDYQRLHELGGDVETIMEMDRFFFGRASWMGWLSRMLLNGMVAISRLFPASIGYGMGIVCLTLLVKLLFWPLTRRSTISMRKMQALQPQLKELREKYKNDPQKMYRKQQELFKENNVSQLGGCLPMLLQIPVFFALFNTFRNAIELRHAGFLWAYDLSMPDDLFFTLFGLPIRPLALLMGLTMYLQQKLTPSADPNQAKMMNMMSIFFIFLFYSMPSALTLYMTINQLLSIVQMAMLRRKDRNQVAITSSAAETGK